MTIRARINLVHGMVAVAVLAFCAALLVILDAADDRRRHLVDSYDQLRGIDAVSSRANRYSEQIAELFVFGATGVEDLDTAYAALVGSIVQLREMVDREAADNDDPGEAVAVRAAQQAVTRMAAVAAEMDVVGSEVLALIQAGQIGAASQLFDQRIESDFDRQMKGLIAEALEREQAQVERIVAAGNDLASQARNLSLALAVAVVGIVGAAAMFFSRNISQPITELTATADAIGRGELVRAAAVGGGELGRLAERFNVMSAEVARQRTALLRAKATLEDTVAERTQELSARSADLEAANARLRALESARTQFFAEISHELRTPLTVIRTEAEVALRGSRCDPEALRAALDIAGRKAKQMSALVDDLLFLARSDTAEWRMTAAEIALQDVVGDVLSDGRALARPDGVTLRAIQPETPLHVRGDAGRLRQVLLIILDNAVKFSPPRGTVTVALTAEDGEARVRIADEGPGLDLADGARAVDCFRRRTSPMAAQARQGAGLGLSIARWIVEKHGGRIEFAKPAGRGAAVEVRLPLVGDVA